MTFDPNDPEAAALVLAGLIICFALMYWGAVTLWG